jgi:hypothetical protein
MFVSPVRARRRAVETLMGLIEYVYQTFVLFYQARWALPHRRDATRRTML